MTTSASARELVREHSTVTDSGCLGRRNAVRMEEDDGVEAAVCGREMGGWMDGPRWRLFLRVLLLVLLLVLVLLQATGLRATRTRSVGDATRIHSLAPRLLAARPVSGVANQDVVSFMCTDRSAAWRSSCRRVVYMR
jgi:hypothetical protein